MRDVLPIDALLEDISNCVIQNSAVILRAAPGAGKTTRVPPCLAEKFPGRIILVEPRRVAAVGAAKRISQELHSDCGKECGFIVRGEKCCSKETKILSVTTGIYLNMLLKDPFLEGVSAVIFDEFHERSMQSDLGFTLTIETLKMLRDDLHTVVMSATIDRNKILSLLPEAKFIDAPGRSYDLTVEHNPEGITISNMVKTCASGVIDVVKKQSGNILVFMPGTGEINQLKDILSPFALENDLELQILHGRLTLDEQNAVLHPSGSKRRIVLATNIAESSVTIPDITIVIDSGYEKRLFHDAASGFDKLETVRISLESADQRAGRAGRTSAGYVKRLWSKNDERSFVVHTAAEIENCDLSALALAIADWGSRADELLWVTVPDKSRLSEAEKLLVELDALDEKGNITSKGREMSDLPVHPRISSMLVNCKKDGSLLKLGCETAAVIEETAAFDGVSTVSQQIRLLREKPEKMRRCSMLARQLKNMMHVQDAKDMAPEACCIPLMRIFPDRIGQYTGSQYRFSGGNSGVMVPDAQIQNHDFIVCALLSAGSGKNNTIRLYEDVCLYELIEEFSDKILQVKTTRMDAESGKITSVCEDKLGELILKSTPCAVDMESAAQAVIFEAFRRQIAIPDVSNKKAVLFLNRVIFAVRQGEDDFPQWHDPQVWKDFLLENLPLTENIRSFNDLKNADIERVMRNFLGYEKCSLLDKLYPEYFITPANCRHAIDYSGEMPTLRAKFQELYGVKTHPAVGKKHIPLKIDLLSPALRSTQITSDLPGFWRGNWQLVRKDMKSRYPKHDWPEDAENALPHTKVRL